MPLGGVLGWLLLKVSDRIPATLRSSWSLIECFDAVSDFQEKSLWCQRFTATRGPLGGFVGKRWSLGVGHRQSASCQHLHEAGQVRTLSADDRREDDQVVEVERTVWSIPPPDVASGPIDPLSPSTIRYVGPLQVVDARYRLRDDHGSDKEVPGRCFLPGRGLRWNVRGGPE